MSQKPENKVAVAERLSSLTIADAAHPGVLSARLNERVLDCVASLGIRFDVADDAPGDYEALAGRATNGLVVWSGASDRTIYGAPEVNWAFRAWHDAGHLLLQEPFTLEGELRVALWQASMLDDDQLASIIMAEVVGQAEHLGREGVFPDDQMIFVKRLLGVAV